MTMTTLITKHLTEGGLQFRDSIHYGHGRKHDGL